MLTCIVQLLVYLIVLLIVLWILEIILAQFIAVPPKIILLIRVLCALLMLIAALNCFGLLPMDGPVFGRLR